MDTYLHKYSYCTDYTYTYICLWKQNVLKDTIQTKLLTMVISGKWNSIEWKMGNNRALLYFWLLEQYAILKNRSGLFCYVQNIRESGIQWGFLLNQKCISPITFYLLSNYFVSGMALRTACMLFKITYTLKHMWVKY